MGKEMTRKVHPMNGSGSVVTNLLVFIVVQGGFIAGCRVGDERAKTEPSGQKESQARLDDKSLTLSGRTEGNQRGESISAVRDGGETGEPQKKIFDIDALYQVHRLVSLDWSQDGERLVFAAVHHSLVKGESRVRIYKTKADGKEIRLLTDEIGAHASPRFSPDGKYVATGSNDFTNDDFTAHVWEVQTGREITSVKYEGPVYSVDFNPDTPSGAGGEYVVSGGGLLA